MSDEDNINMGVAEEEWGEEVSEEETETTSNPLASLLDEVEEDDSIPAPRNYHDPALLAKITEKIEATDEGKALKFPGKLSKPLNSVITKLRKKHEKPYPTKGQYKGEGDSKELISVTVWT